MHYIHIFRRELHFLFVQNVEIFHADIIFFVEETFFLYAGHVKDIQFRKRVFEADYFTVRDFLIVKHILTDIIRKTQLFRGDQYKTDPGVAYKCVNQRVDGTTEFQVAAQTDR